MGSASTKFRKHLQAGDEVQALQLYRNNAELRKVLDPNCSYGDSHHHETPLHLASRHGMQMLLGIFLFSKAGNPNKTNARKETCLHCLCQQDSSWQSAHSNKRRAECLNYLLKWRGARLAEGTLERIDLAAQDEKLNTALHYAAASGLTQCVETLIQQGAPLFVENEDQLTPCDTAERNGHNNIALYLESKMVFSNDEEPVDEEDDISMPPMEEYSGLRPQDLQEAKDMLLVETADMLSVPLFTAEALLRNHEWSRETLLESWMMDPVACCEKCGVTPPASLFSDKPQVQENLTSPLPSPLHSAPLPLDAECDICANTFLIADEPVQITCSHKFCKDCWERYLNVKIQEGDAHHITCPAFDCTMLVPVDVIEGIVSRDMARRYLQFDIKAFVDSNPDMKWCPFPGCGRAVKLPELDTGSGNGGHASRASGGVRGQRGRIPSDTSRGVDCGGGHYFCWECLEESHEPCSCTNWHSWFEKIADVKPETCKYGDDAIHDTEQETEFAANCLWLVTNSKPCPNCKSPIQKNEGCNHMKCSKCKHDFCWVCLEQWKRHNSSTGGYFMCNRYEVVKKVEEQNAQMLTDAESKNKNMQELNRFVHYYSRFKNHENSFKLEEPLLKTAKDKMMKLAEAVTDNATAQTETKFVEDAVQQLLKARRVLKCSYVYGYYLDGPGYKKIVFEFMQTELEECTEILSQMVNRLYLRTPRRKIIDQAHVVQRKRQEFIMAISKGLVPAETPPSVRKKRKKKKKMANEVVDEDLHRAIVESIKEVDPSNPWIKDASGKHTNVVALLDWPSEDSDDSETEADQKENKASMGKCQRANCPKLRAKNPRTQEAHEYCSRWCMLVDKDLKNEEEGEEGVSDVVLDEHMELLRALEMSRLQYLRESGLLHVPDSQQSDASTKGTQTRRKARPRSNSAGQDVKSPRPAVSSMEDFDIELQRFQELSAGFPKGDRNDVYDMRQHLHPSHAKHSLDIHSQQHQQQRSSRTSTNQTSRFDESRSTIVTRVPNKSVEDLYCLDPSVKCSNKQQTATGQASGLGSPVLGSTRNPAGSSTSSSPSALSTFSSLAADRKSYSSSSHTLPPPPPDLLSFTSNHPPPHEDRDNDAGLHGTMFGAIKDLSVSNIHSNESDKTKDFTNKDLVSIFASLDLEKKNEEEDADADFSSSLSSFMWPASTMPKNDLSARGYGNSGSLNTGKGYSSILYSEVSGVTRSGDSVGAKSSLWLDKGKCRAGDGRRRVKGESGKRAVLVEDSSVGDGYGYSSGRQERRSSPLSLHSGIGDGNDEVMDMTNSQGVGSEVSDGVGAGEVSLLKMAENLVQMTADVHLRMKEVEKGIRDLDSRSKLKSLKRTGGGEGCKSNVNMNSEECNIPCTAWTKEVDGDGQGEGDDRYGDKICVGAIGGVGKDGRSLAGVSDAEILSVSSDVDDMEQWFDVPDIVPIEEDITPQCSSSFVSTSSNPPPASFTDANPVTVENLTQALNEFENYCDDHINVTDHIIDNNGDNNNNNSDDTAEVEIENDLSITSAGLTTTSAYSKKSYTSFGLRLAETEQQQQLTDSTPSSNASKYSTAQKESRSSALPFFQSLLLKSPELSDNLLPSCGDDKDYSDSTREKDLDLTFAAQTSVGNVLSFSPSSIDDRDIDNDSKLTMSTSGNNNTSNPVSFGIRSMASDVEENVNNSYTLDNVSDSASTQSVLTADTSVGSAAGWGRGREEGSGRSKAKGKGGRKSKEEEGGKSKKGKGKHRKEEEFFDSVYV